MMFRAHTAADRKPNRRVANRRKKKSQHLLDVNIRSDRARSQRNQRIVLFGCKVLLVFSIAVGLIYGVRESVNRLFFANPTYTLNHIELQMDGTLTREQILKTADLREGVNIFSIKLPATRQALLDLPQVGDAEVQRQLPDTLRVTIHERHPVAWLVANRRDIDSLDHTQALMIDDEGVVLQSKALLPEYLRMPVIAGYPVEGLRLGKKVDAPELQSALTLLRKASDSLAGRFDIQLIDLTRGYCLEVVDREKTAVRFAFEDPEKQLQRLGLLLDYCDANRQKMESVNLMIQRNVPVTFVHVETTTLDPVTGKPVDVDLETGKPVKKALPAPVTKKRKTTNGKG